MTKRQLSQFCSHLSLLLSSGVPLIESLGIIKNISSLSSLDQVVQKLSEGESLENSLKNYFPPMLTGSIAAAERAGNLEEVLKRLAKYYETRAEASEKIKSAMLYPSFVIFLCLASLLMIFFFVLPGFKEMFADLESDLPLFTLFLLGLGDFLARFWYLLVVFLGALAILLIKYWKTNQGRHFFDRLFLKSKLYSREQIAQSFHTLGSLLQGGVPIIEAMNTAIKPVKNKVFQGIMSRAKDAVENGERLSWVLSQHKVFPAEAVQMVLVGENTGRLDEMLLSVAAFYEKEREVFVQRATSMLEPALTLFVGLIVGTIALAMFLPMIEMISKLQ
ncbi:MAG: type II secretion system F family protein [bacterium]